jgi:outer membrane scaffolding protein for murein synthesis (MipA/OmpV family)
MGNVAGTAGAYGFFEWRPVKDAVTVYGNLLRSARSQNGTLATLGATLALPVTPRLSGFVDVYANWADQRYTQTYYGVDNAQAALAAYPVYAAKSGLLSTTPSVGVNYTVDKHWDVIAYVGRTRLSSGAAVSPMVQNPSQSVAAVFVKYQR